MYAVLFEQLQDKLFGEVLSLHNFHLDFDDSAPDLIWQQEISLIVCGSLLFFRQLRDIFWGTPQSLHLFIFRYKLCIILNFILLAKSKL